MYRNLWFASLKGISRTKRRIFLEDYGDPGRLFEMSSEELKKTELFNEKDIRRIISDRSADTWESRTEVMEKKKIRLAMIFDDLYPERLKNIPDPPLGIFWKGSLPDGKKRSVGMVGARDCSAYGRKIADYLGGVFAKNGIQVISGMARGVDSASHAGALKQGGATFAVLGCGCDVCYPRSSVNLYRSMIDGSGGVLSEYLPGEEPVGWHFPERNRILSGLSDCLIVVEARERSGSLITADQALEQGKDVFAIPGRVGDGLSAGCNRLIAQGAGFFMT